LTSVSETLLSPKRIALFDSGVGGLSVLRQLLLGLELVQHKNGNGRNEVEFYYLGDTARCPYGSRAKEEIADFVEEIVLWLAQFSPDYVVMACNTSCAMAREEAVQAAGDAGRILDLIEPTARFLARQAADNEVIAVMSTVNTANSQAFSRQLAKAGFKGRVKELGCPNLVPLIESGRLNTRQCQAQLQEALTEYLSELSGASYLVLGCTHFPFVQEEIAGMVKGPLSALFPQGLKLIDPALCLASRLWELPYEELSLANFNLNQLDKVKVYTTGDAVEFGHAGSRCLGEELEDVHHVALEHLAAPFLKDVPLKSGVL
jgi:glutamate racemase